MKDYIASSREEGREEGIEEGKISGQREIAKKMLDQGLDISLIENCTGLII
jgi:predicted transposase/invertase (TIGR01784 family)